MTIASEHEATLLAINASIRQNTGDGRDEERDS